MNGNLNSQNPPCFTTARIQCQTSCYNRH